MKPAEQCVRAVQEGLTQAGRPFQLGPVDHFGGTDRWGVPPSLTRQRPIASKFSSVRADRVHDLMTRRASRVGPVLLDALAHGQNRRVC